MREGERLPSEALSEEVRAISERRLSPQEFAALADTPISDAEREHTLALMSWFARRYPSGAERLAYVRQAYARWARSTTRP